MLRRNHKRSRIIPKKSRIETVGLKTMHNQTNENFELKEFYKIVWINLFLENKTDV